MTKQKKMRRQKALGQALFGLSLLFLLLALSILAWAVWPSSTDSIQLSIPAGTLPGAPVGADYASQADYTLTLEWPTRLRKGQEGALRATLVEAGNGAAGRETQSVLIEPVLSGVMLDPPGLVQANLAAGQTLVETWGIDAGTAGDFSGKIYVSFGFYDEENAELIAVPVAVVDMATRVTSIWGLSNQLALWFGLVAFAFWGALFILGRVVQGEGK